MLEHSKIYRVSEDIEVESLFENNKIVAKYGIPCLDRELKGILKSDLILIGASTGCGKSTIAKLIAEANSKEGKEVTVISLENFKGDDLLDSIYQEYKNLSKQYDIDIIDFIDLYNKKQLDKAIFEQAKKNAKKRYKNIKYIFRENENYTTEQLQEDVEYIYKETLTDLIILDHVDYLDKNCGENDIDHITKLMSTIRSLQLVYKIPMVCISHLRKNGASNPKNPVLIPSLDDFIGSSNKTKIATVVIILAPDDAEDARNENLKKYEKPTFCCVRKHRKLGRKVVGYTYRMIFNLKTGEYEQDNIQEYKVDYYGTKIVSKEPIVKWGK